MQVEESPISTSNHTPAVMRLDFEALFNDELKGMPPDAPKPGNVSARANDTRRLDLDNEAAGNERERNRQCEA